MALGGRLNGWSVWISSAVLSSIRLWLLGLSWVIVLDLSLLSLPSVFFLSFSSVALLLSLLVIKCLLASVLVLYSDVLVLSCSVPTLLTLEGDQWFALKLFLFFTSWCAWVRLHTWIYSHANVGRSRCNCTSMDFIHALTYIYIYMYLYYICVCSRVCICAYICVCMHTHNKPYRDELPALYRRWCCFMFREQLKCVSKRLPCVWSKCARHRASHNSF